MFDWSGTRGELRFTQEKISSGAFLFREQLNRVTKLCELFDKEKINEFPTNRVISVVGERGTGKSTFLNVLENHLGKNSYLVLDRVDPSIFDDSISIMELFVTQMYSKVTTSNMNNKDVSDYSRINIVKQLSDITQLLISLRNESVFYQENSTADIIHDVLGKVNFSDKIDFVVRDFLHFMSSSNHQYKNIVLIIDDLDLVNNKTTYKMLDNLQKYLATNIIIIVAYRNKQLINAVSSEIINDNKILMDCNMISKDEIEIQTSRFIEKLLPLNNRVYLFSGEELLKQNVLTILDPFINDRQGVIKLIEDMSKQITLENNDDHNSLKSFVNGLVYNRTRIKQFPYDKTELNSLVIPSNLRGVIFMLEFFLEMEDPNSVIYPDKKIQIENTIRQTYFEEKNIDLSSLHVNSLKAFIIKENIIKYKSYLMSQINESLTHNHISFLEEWSERPINVKNYFALNYFLDLVNSNDFKVEINDESNAEILRLKSKMSNNITLGDVWQSIEFLKELTKNIEVYRLIYALKQFYSIELIYNYFNFALIDLLPEAELDISIIQSKRRYFDNYTKLIMRSFVPDTFEVYESQQESDFQFKNLTYDSSNNDSYDRTFFEKMYVDSYKGEPRKTSDDELKMLYILTEKVSFLKVTSKGHVYRSANGFDSGRLNSFKYRDIYYFGENVHHEMKSNSFYLVNPFIYFTNEKYIIESTKINSYIFLSLFDIDVFYRKNYYRAKEERFKYLLNSINSVFTNSNDKHRSFFNDHWTGFLFNKKEFVFPFSKEDIQVSTLFEKLMILNENTKTVNPKDFIKKGKKFKEYSFPRQMDLLELFFNQSEFANNPEYVELENFNKVNRRKSFVAKSNKDFYKKILTRNVLAELDLFISGLV